MMMIFHLYELQKSGDYLAIPITINVVLIISDTLLIWASASKNKLLLWPWIILHLLEFLFFISMLILLMVIVPEPWFKVVVFLVGSPVIVLLVSDLKISLAQCGNFKSFLSLRFYVKTITRILAV